MLPIRIQQSQYVVSFDNLDLAFLQQYVEKSIHYEMPLWSKPDLDGESKLYEVEIIENLDSDSSYVESSNNIMCYVCNRDVPRSYFKQHTESLMHNNFKILVKTILENVSKHLVINKESSEATNQNENYFCDICSKIVLIENKKKHIRSNYHKKCKENEKQIETFLAMYTKSLDASGTDDIGNGNDNMDLYHAQGSNDYKDIEYYTYTDVSGNSTGINSEGSNENISAEKNKNIEDFPSEILTEPSTSKSSAQEKLKNVSAFFNLDETVCIETPSGYKGNVKMKNFHSYDECAGVMFCQICDCWITVDIQEHSINEEHFVNLQLPINDDFIRNLINKRLSHCILCNVMINKDSDHTRVDPNHRELISAVLKNNIDLAQIKTDFSDQTEVNKPNKNLSNTTTTPKNKDITHCNICKINLHYGSVHSHKVGKRHRENTTRQLREGIKHIEQHVHKIAAELLDNHVESSTAIATTATYFHKKMELVMTKEELYEYSKHMTKLNSKQLKCLICGIKVAHMYKNIVYHFKGRNHLRYTNALLGENKMTVITKHKIYNCEYCDTNVSDFFNHIHENNIHIKNKLLNGVIDEIKLKEYIYENSTHNSLLAIVYRKIFKELLKQNHIVEIDTSTFNCQICDMQLSRNSAIDHMLGEKPGPCQRFSL